MSLVADRLLDDYTSLFKGGHFPSLLRLPDDTNVLVMDKPRHSTRKIDKGQCF